MADEVTKISNNLGMVTANYRAPVVQSEQITEIEVMASGLNPILIRINIRAEAEPGPVVIRFTLTEDGQIL